MNPNMKGVRHPGLTSKHWEIGHDGIPAETVLPSQPYQTTLCLGHFKSLWKQAANFEQPLR